MHVVPTVVGSLAATFTQNILAIRSKRIYVYIFTVSISLHTDRHCGDSLSHTHTHPHTHTPNLCVLSVCVWVGGWVLGIVIYEILAVN